MNNPVLAARLATMAVLFCNGLLYATWGVSVPLIKKIHHLSDGILSLSMAAVAIGGIVTMGFSGRWIAVIGSAKACLQSGLLMAVFAFPLLMITHYSILLFTLIGYGCVIAANDVAANTQVAYLEKISGRSLIGSVHGSFSAGGLVGALVASIWFSSSLPSELNFVFIGILSFVIVWISSRFLQDEPKKQPDKLSNNITDKSVAPHQVRLRLCIFGLLAFSALVIEGAFYDWAAIYMREIVKAPSSWSGIGYAAFAIAMALGRLFGDSIRERLRHQIVVAGSGIISLIGLAVIIWNYSAQLVVIGFLIVGFGVSNMIPLLFSSAGKLATSSGWPASEGLAITTRIAYIGLLAGPLLIGPIAEMIGLRLSLIVLGIAIMVICCGWLLLSRLTSGTPWFIPHETKPFLSHQQQN